MADIFIIGAAGILGSKLKQSAKLTNLREFPPQPNWSIPTTVQPGSTFIFLRSLSSPYKVALDPRKSNEINVVKTKKLISDLLNLGHRIIFASSDVVYGNTPNFAASEKTPTAPYGLYATQKDYIEKEFLSDNNFASLRISLMTGVGSKLRKALSENRPLQIPHPVFRSPIHVSFVVKAIETLAESKQNRFGLTGGVLNLGGSEFMSIYELAAAEAVNCGAKKPVRVERSMIDQNSRPREVKLDSTLASDLLRTQMTWQGE